MGTENQQKLGGTFAALADKVARAAGHAGASAIATAIIVAWAVSGPFFNYSETWQLVINTGTTIVTFLMVFLIQNSQNRDGAAVQAKLDELVRSSSARNEFIGIEHLSEEEVAAFRSKCAEMARTKGDRAVARSNRIAHEAADAST